MNGRARAGGLRSATGRALVRAALAGALLGVPAAAADALAPARQREILRQALSAYDAAVAAAPGDRARAEELLRQAAAGFEALRAAGLCTAALEYNLGNVHFRLGDLGRAILHYRRAARLDPGDARLAANLRYARDRVEPSIAPSGRHRLLRQLLFWHYETPAVQRFRALLALSLIGWPLLVAWLRWRRRPLLAGGLVAVGLALAAGGSLRWELYDEARRPPAVVVAREVPLRLGRGTGSDLALRQPLGPGVEVRILRAHGEWVEVRLASDLTGWLPADAVERI